MNLPSENELSALVERIANVRVLREHHVWEAVRCLSIDVRDHRSDGPWRFVELMEADALLDAVVHLTTLAEQKCSVTSIRNAGGGWTCTIRCPSAAGKAAGTVRAEHADLPAAILEGFILSQLQPRRGSGRKARVSSRENNWRFASCPPSKRERA